MRLVHYKKSEGERKGHRNLGKEPQSQKHEPQNPSSCLFTFIHIKPNGSQQKRDKLFKKLGFGDSTKTPQLTSQHTNSQQHPKQQQKHRKKLAWRQH